MKRRFCPSLSAAAAEAEAGASWAPLPDNVEINRSKMLTASFLSGLPAPCRYSSPSPALLAAAPAQAAARLCNRHAGCETGLKPGIVAKSSKSRCCLGADKLSIPVFLCSIGTAPSAPSSAQHSPFQRQHHSRFRHMHLHPAAHAPACVCSSKPHPLHAG